jgi:hypothetical protein
LENLLIITPVKDALETAQQAIALVCQSKHAAEYRVYNDLSRPENTIKLDEGQEQGYTLINIAEKVDTPSPNYRFTLRDAQRGALEMNAALLIVESDVYVQPDTIERLQQFAATHSECGMVAAVTVDENNAINFPYLHIQPKSNEPIDTSHRLSFCCTLLTLPLLKQLDFDQLSDKKDWFDVQISRDSRRLGFVNYVLPDVRVRHLPHSSRPWKQLKYTHPVKYYLKKWFLGKDRI